MKYAVFIIITVIGLFCYAAAQDPQVRPQSIDSCDDIQEMINAANNEYGSWCNVPKHIKDKVSKDAKGKLCAFEDTMCWDDLSNKFEMKVK